MTYAVCLKPTKPLNPKPQARGALTSFKDRKSPPIIWNNFGKTSWPSRRAVFSPSPKWQRFYKCTNSEGDLHHLPSYPLNPKPWAMGALAFLKDRQSSIIPWRKMDVMTEPEKWTAIEYFASSQPTRTSYITKWINKTLYTFNRLKISTAKLEIYILRNWSIADNRAP